MLPCDSPTVQNAMCAEAPFEPERLIEALNEAGVDFVVVGGLAVGAHGVVRATRDLDLVPAPNPENLDALARVMGERGAKHPMGTSLDADSIARPISMKLQTSHGEVHVLNRMPATPPYEDLSRDSISIEIVDGVVARVCSLHHLRQMKSASDRPRDAVDLAELDELHGPA